MKAKVKLLREAAYYPKLAKWIGSHFNCFRTASGVGLRHSRADVIGVRDVGGRLSSDIEIVVVEVKRGTEPFATASGQTLGYSVYANRVYLADRRDSGFRHDELQIASRLGIGLIAIGSSRCVEVLSSPFHEPMPRMASEILSKLALGECRICGVFFSTGPNKSKPDGHLVKNSINRAAASEKGLVFWNQELGSRKRKLKLPGYHVKEGWSYDRRFICKECVQTLWPRSSSGAT